MISRGVAVAGEEANSLLGQERRRGNVAWRGGVDEREDGKCKEAERDWARGRRTSTQVAEELGGGKEKGRGAGGRWAPGAPGPGRLQKGEPGDPSTRDSGPWTSGARKPLAHPLLLPPPPLPEMASGSRWRTSASTTSPPLGPRGSEQQGGSQDGVGSSWGSSVTVRKKALCSNSLLESTDYWLQNQRTPCQIGFVEEKAEHCASVCFVNLDANPESSSSDLAHQKLVSVSPDLPKLISSGNIQQPKENEIVLLSGLPSSRNLQADLEVSQCPWAPEICLVQCARGNKPNSTECIVFEINKFLLGLQLGLEQWLLLEPNTEKSEDNTACSEDTACSEASREEEEEEEEDDFFTAYEYLEDESEVDEYKDGQEDLSVSGTLPESKEPKEDGPEEQNWTMGKFPPVSKELSMSTELLNPSRAPGHLEESLNQGTEAFSLPVTTPIVLSGQQEGAGGPDPSHTLGEMLKGQVENPFPMNTPEDDVSRRVKGELNLVSATTPEPGSKPVSGSREGEQKPLALLHEEDGGKSAPDVGDSVLQETSISVSPSWSSPTKEAPSGRYVGNSLIPDSCTTEVSRPWHDLPKIVIVQSPDSSETTFEDLGTNCPTLRKWPEPEASAGIPSPDLREDAAASRPQLAEGAVPHEVPLTEAISSPSATGRFWTEQEAPVAHGEMADGEASQEVKASQATEYSFPSALRGVAQVASAVAVCGLGEGRESRFPAAAADFRPPAWVPAAVNLPWSAVLASGVGGLNGGIAEALLKEAFAVLARPKAYHTVGDFLESVNGRIIEAASRPRGGRLENVYGDKLAQNLSSVILERSLEEVNQKMKTRNTEAEGNVGLSPHDLFLDMVNKLLFEVIYFTIQQMGDVAQFSEHSLLFSKSASRWEEVGVDGQSLENTSGLAVHPTAPAHSSSSSVSNAPNAKPGDGLGEAVLPEKERDIKGEVIPDTAGSPALPTELTCENGHLLVAKLSPKKKSLYQNPRLSKDEFVERESPFSDSEWRHSPRELTCAGDNGRSDVPEKCQADTLMNHEVQDLRPFSGSGQPLSSQAACPGKPWTAKYWVTDFAEELAETVVSMATEIAAICLDNANGKQPWFCAWKRGNEYLVTQSLSCCSSQRKTDSQAGGTVLKKHRPPRLREIKRKTDEHPELKERLMNRVVDDSVSLDEAPDSVSGSGNEVAAKTMHLAELTLADGAWPGQSYSRNRSPWDRWNRVKAPSCESIAEEAPGASTLGLMGGSSQPGSRASSVSKQSSCESITEEFSRFMVNQMESEGRGLDLLLDYYAGKSAGSILAAAVQQASQNNGHLSVKPSCPSKQSSTESITEEFYRYMLRDVERDGRGGSSSARSPWEGSSGLLMPSPRSSLCYRQFSMPDGRPPGPRLTVSVPLKANSLDDFAQGRPQDLLSVQPVGNVPPSLCKSDSCLYRRHRADRITDMLIHETWANSIEALMRKNKILVESGEGTGGEPVSRGSLCHTGRSVDGEGTRRDRPAPEPKGEGGPGPSPTRSESAPVMEETPSEFRKERFTGQGISPLRHSSTSSCSMEVPLIHIEMDQKEEWIERLEPFVSENPSSRTLQERLDKEKAIGMVTEKSLPPTSGSGESSSTSSLGFADLEMHPETRAPSPSINELAEEKEYIKEQLEKVEDRTPGRSVGKAGCSKTLLVINLDLEPKCPDAELRTALQWIAASELGIPTIYFQKSPDGGMEKFLDVVQLVHRKSWKVGDIFRSVVQYCKLQEENQAQTPSLFDWLLELG
uniref:A-kinase anchor 110kDa C-terminal domain-containing protein n=1 Tax=Ornithorhynchus anatinus TaxID=9258 RepID=A0A6I8NTV6_ORNAN